MNTQEDRIAAAIAPHLVPGADAWSVARLVLSAAFAEGVTLTPADGDDMLVEARMRVTAPVAMIVEAMLKADDEIRA